MYLKDAARSAHSGPHLPGLRQAGETGPLRHMAYCFVSGRRGLSAFPVPQCQQPPPGLPISCCRRMAARTGASAAWRFPATGQAGFPPASPAIRTFTAGTSHILSGANAALCRHSRACRACCEKNPFTFKVKGFLICDIFLFLTRNFFVQGSAGQHPRHSIFVRGDILFHCERFVDIKVDKFTFFVRNHTI